MTDTDLIMQEIVDRLRFKRLQLGYSYQDLATLTGMSKSTLQRYETGEIKNIPLSKLKILASALQTTPDWILGWGNKLNRVSNVIPLDPNSIVMLPVYGKIAAGIPIMANQENDETFPVDTRFFNMNGYSIHDFFFLKVQGDSMEPGIMDGDLVLVRKQATVETNEIGVVLCNGEDATIKRVTVAGDKVVLNSDNKDYPPLIYSATECQILGKVLQRVGKVK